MNFSKEFTESLCKKLSYQEECDYILQTIITYYEKEDLETLLYDLKIKTRIVFKLSHDKIIVMRYKPSTKGYGKSTLTPYEISTTKLDSVATAQKVITTLHKKLLIENYENFTMNSDCNNYTFFIVLSKVK